MVITTSFPVSYQIVPSADGPFVVFLHIYVECVVISVFSSVNSEVPILVSLNKGFIVVVHVFFPRKKRFYYKHLILEAFVS